MWCNVNSFCTISLDTGCKLNVHKTCRRLPGRVLNILCTFDLRHVSRGILVETTAKRSTFQTEIHVDELKSIKLLRYHPKYLHQNYIF